MRGHSCAKVDLFTKLSPEDGDEGRDLHSHALALLSLLVRALEGWCS